MQYVELPPCAALAPWVECLWALEGPAPPPDADEEPVLPDGCMEVVFHVGAPFRRRALLDDGDATQHRDAVVGQIERALLLSPTGPVGLVAVRLRPEGGARLLGVAAHELTGRSARLDEVWARGSAEIEERVHGARDVVSALESLEACVVRRAGDARAPLPAVAQAVALARRTAGAVDVSDLARAAGLSTRQLERGFRAEVGLAPKRFLRVLRVQRAARLLQEGGAAAAEIALACGYYDEAHLHRDFRDVVGASPGRWRAGDHGLSDRLIG